MKKINCCVLWWKQYGEKALYSLGTDGKRYFSSWSESRWPRQDEDGRDVDPLEYAEEIYPTMQRDATLVMDEAAIYLDGDIGYAGHEMIRQLINLIDEEE